LVCGPQRLARTWEAPGAGTCRRSWMGGCITGTSYAPPILTDSLPPPAMAPPALCVSMAHRTSDMSDSDDNDVDDVLVMDLVPTPAISSASSSLSVRLPPPPFPPPPPPLHLPIPSALPLVMALPTLLCQLFPYLYVGSKETAPLHPSPPAHQTCPVT
jgi:hypothetical protein